MQARLYEIATNNIQPLSPDVSVLKALHYMQKHQISSVTIVNKQSYPVGIFTEHDALKLIAIESNKEIPIEDVMTKDPFCVADDFYLHDGYILMEEKGFRHLILIDKNKKYSGIVTEGDFLRHLGFEAITTHKNVFDYMSNSIVMVDESTDIQEIASIMYEKKSEYAIILHSNTPIGIISEREIAYSNAANKHSSLQKAKDIKPKKLNKIKENASVQEASQLMKEHGVHQLLVINEKEEFIGVITRHNLLKAIHGTYFDLLIKTIENKTAQERALLQHKKELESLVNYDQLTNLPNRQFFKTNLNNLCSKIERYGQKAALILLDVDKFQNINDSFGHTMGDELLVMIAKRLKNRIRKYDMLSRLGGDEFAIIIDQYKEIKDVIRIVEDILRELRDEFQLSNKIIIKIEASAGIVLLPQDANSAETALQYADSALNRAKKSGRANYKFYTQEMTQQYFKNLEFEQKLKDAIQNNEFEMYYQPQVDIKTDKIIGAEALIRWNSADGLVPPNQFIPIAEESFLINDIGKWVLEDVCKQGKIWYDKGYRLSLAVNLSSNQLQYQNIKLLINEILQKTKFPTNLLEIEITEGAVMDNVKEGMELLHAIKALGIKIAIDDFGTGYSSLSYLKKFPIDVLKIDKSFVDNLPHNHDDVAISKAIINMAKALDYKVLAEGVETQEQLAFLQEHKCDIFQGYYKSKPLPAREFEKLLGKNL